MTRMKDSAFSVITGLILNSIGALILFFATQAMLIASLSYSPYSSSSSAGGVAGMVIGLGCLFIGTWMFLVGIYRALAKIDAIEVRVENANADVNMNVF